MVFSPFPHSITHSAIHLTNVTMFMTMLITFSIYKELNLVIPSLPLSHSPIKGIRIIHRNMVLMLKSLNRQRISYIQSLKIFYLVNISTFKTFFTPIYYQHRLII